jgi:hypothetical protein
MPPAERFILMTGLLLAVVGGIALWGLSYGKFQTSSAGRATITGCVS